MVDDLVLRRRELDSLTLSARAIRKVDILTQKAVSAGNAVIHLVWKDGALPNLNQGKMQEFYVIQKCFQSMSELLAWSSAQMVNVFRVLNNV